MAVTIKKYEFSASLYREQAFFGKTKGWSFDFESKLGIFSNPLKIIHNIVTSNRARIWVSKYMKYGFSTDIHHE
jgi:hypothetical protein